MTFVMLCDFSHCSLQFSLFLYSFVCLLSDSTLCNFCFFVLDFSQVSLSFTLLFLFFCV